MKDGDHLPRGLVVAEEPSIRDRAQVALTLHGCAVTTAATGTEALRRAGSADHDLIVLDAVLPDLDGFEVYRRLRAGGDRLPVIFLTATGAAPGTVTGLAVAAATTSRSRSQLRHSRPASWRASVRRTGQPDRTGRPGPPGRPTVTRNPSPRCMPGTWNSMRPGGLCTGPARKWNSRPPSSGCSST